MIEGRPERLWVALLWAQSIVILAGGFWLALDALNEWLK